jgi:hypothetical protein
MTRTPQRPGRRLKWPAAVVDRVRALHAEGLGDGEIARHMPDVLHAGDNGRQQVRGIRVSLGLSANPPAPRAPRVSQDTRKRRNATPSAIVQEIIRRYTTTDETLESIGHAVGRSRGAVWSVLWHRGIKRGRLPHVTEEQRARVRAAYAGSATLTAAAVAGGCSLYTAWATVRAAGLTRPQPDVADLAAAIAELVSAESDAERLTAWEIGRRLGVQLADVLAVQRGTAAPVNWSRSARQHRRRSDPRNRML